MHPAYTVIHPFKRNTTKYDETQNVNKPFTVHWYAMAQYVKRCNTVFCKCSTLDVYEQAVYWKWVNTFSLVDNEASTDIDDVFATEEEKKNEIPFGNSGNHKTDFVCVCVCGCVCVCVYSKLQIQYMIILPKSVCIYYKPVLTCPYTVLNVTYGCNV